jgi:uncharacterized protein YgiM (DUF1202 family)
MQSLIKLLIVICVVSIFAATGLAQQAATPGQAEPNVQSFPYTAEINSDNVNARSGPGTNYYRCAQLKIGDKVTVVGSKFGWSQIVPTAGSFSWISKQYVGIDPNDASIGIVTGEAVRVYAGSEELKPIHSTTSQVRLNRGDKVRLMGEQEGDYYKIVPPAGAYLWITTKYATAVARESETKPPVEPGIKPALKPEPPAVAPSDISLEAQKLNEYYALEKQIAAERAKPLGEQNYSTIKQALLKISEQKEAGKAARYSVFALKQVERCELAIKVGKEVQLQDEQLQTIRQRIDKAHDKKVAEVPDLGKFAVIGNFQSSNVYGPDAELLRYRVTDETDKTVCYAVPSESAAKMAKADLDKFVGHKVGLVGTIEPHSPTACAMVQFTEIVQLD